MEIPHLIEIGDGAELTVTWGDAHVDRLSAAELRAACPCAGCRGLTEAPPGTRVRTVRLVGGYAIAMTFGPDGHATGIYPFELLRSLGTGSA